MSDKDNTGQSGGVNISGAISTDILHFPARVLVRHAATGWNMAVTSFPGRVLPIY
jgi:hypothetical protein